jgi:tripartite ATP-independent transporter DctM subunit
MLSIVIFAVFAITMAVGIPIAFSLYFTSFAILVSMKIPTMMMVQRVIAGIEKEPLLCIPFFILAGSIMSGGGMTQRLIHFSNLLVGRFRGALGLVSVLASMFFAGLSGSAVADATAIGSVLIPAMKKEGYKAEFSSAIIASAACCGPLIPPSIPMVVLGILCSLPIGRLFLAAAFPGIMLGIILLVGAYIAAVRHNYPKHRPYPLRDIAKGLKTSGLALAMPLILVAGIASGAVTDSELGVLAALYALIVGISFYRELNVQKIMECLKDTVLSTAIVMFIMGAASLLGWLLTVSGVPQFISKSIFSVTSSKVLILMMINALLVAVGCIMDPIAAILLLAPILIPLGVSIGMDPIHFSVMMVFNLMIGNLTPPVGMTLIIASRFADISIGRAARAVLPYIGLSLIVLIIITAFPWFSLFLPNLFF